MTQFEVGNTYFARSACDYDCVFSNVITARTAKTVTLDNGKVCRVREYDDVERISPKGTYSMSPTYSADRPISTLKA